MRRDSKIEYLHVRDPLQNKSEIWVTTLGHHCLNLMLSFLPITAIYSTHCFTFIRYNKGAFPAQYAVDYPAKPYFDRM